MVPFDNGIAALSIFTLEYIGASNEDFVVDSKYIKENIYDG